VRRILGRGHFEKTGFEPTSFRTSSYYRVTYHSARPRSSADGSVGFSRHIIGGTVMVALRSGWQASAVPAAVAQAGGPAFRWPPRAPSVKLFLPSPSRPSRPVVTEPIVSRQGGPKSAHGLWGTD